jgi:hypothetical protein
VLSTSAVLSAASVEGAGVGRGVVRVFGGEDVFGGWRL